MECAAGNELEIELKMYDLKSQYYVAQYLVLHHFYYEYRYSPHKLAFQNIMRVGDRKLMINLEWPYIQRKIFFRRSFFLCSLCPNLEGIKDALCYMFRRPTIGQNCSAVCTNKGGHRDAFSSERREALRVSRGLPSRPLSLEQSER